MLGRLARWLRLLGFDTLYEPDIKDSDLLRIALKDDRYILTRDGHFLGRKNLRKLFMVSSEKPIDQVREVLTVFSVKECGAGRCAQCNGVIAAVGERESVRGQVPEHVFLSCRDFFRCGACGRLFWEGTHMRSFRGMVARGLQGGCGV